MRASLPPTTACPSPPGFAGPIYPLRQVPGAPDTPKSTANGMALRDHFSPGAAPTAPGRAARTCQLDLHRVPLYLPRRPPQPPKPDHYDTIGQTMLNVRSDTTGTYQMTMGTDLHRPHRGGRAESESSGPPRDPPQPPTTTPSTTTTTTTTTPSGSRIFHSFVGCRPLPSRSATWSR